MIVDNELLQKIIAQQYPFFMIDESQDTKKELIAAFFEIERNVDDNLHLDYLGIKNNEFIQMARSEL